MDLIHSQALIPLWCWVGFVLLPCAGIGQTIPESPRVEAKDKESDRYFRESIQKEMEMIEKRRREGIPIGNLEEIVKAMKAFRQIMMDEDRLEYAGLTWFDLPENWSLKAKLIKQSATEVMVEITTTNLTKEPRALNSGGPLRLYRLVWKGNQPEPLFDPAKLPEPRSDGREIFPDPGAARSDTINLAEFAKLEPGKTYTVEVRRVLDFAGLHPWLVHLASTHWVAAEPITFERQNQ